MFHFIGYLQQWSDVEYCFWVAIYCDQNIEMLIVGYRPSEIWVCRVAAVALNILSLRIDAVVP